MDDFVCLLIFFVAVLLSVTMILVFLYIKLSKEVERRVVVQRRLDDVARNLPAVIYKLKVSGEEVSLLFIIGNSEKMFGVLSRDIERDPMLLLRKIGVFDTKYVIGRLIVSSRHLAPVYREFSFNEDGEKRWLGTFLEPRCLENGDVHWNGYWVDITAQHRQAEALSIAKNDAEVASKSMKSMLAIVSHELRTPLSVIVGIIDLLRRRGGGSKDQRYWLGQLEMTAEGQLQLLEDILDYFKIEAGQMKIYPEKTDVREVVCHSVNIMSDNIFSKGLDLVLDIDSSLAGSHWVDGRRLRQVLFNLISNACKFTEVGGIDITLEVGGVCDEVQDVKIMVSDTGVGISKAEQEELFTPFSQAYNCRVQNAGGTGLGLSICKQLVEAMGGTISLLSELGKGVVVIIEIPLKVVDYRNPCPLLDNVEISLEIGDEKSRRAVKNALYYHGATINYNKEMAAVVLSDEVDGLSKNKIRLIKLPKSRLLDHEMGVVSLYPLQHEEMAYIILDFIGGGVSKLGEKESISNLSVSLKILLAEDNAVVRSVIKEQLCSLGQSVDAVGNGAEAWELLKEKDYDILFTDCYMPGVDGMELSRMIADDERLSRLHVIGMTANAQEKHVSECLSHGMQKVMVKPITSDMLLEMLSSTKFENDGGKPFFDEAEGGCAGEKVKDEFDITEYSDKLVDEWVVMTKKDIQDLEGYVDVGDEGDIINNIHKSLGSLQLFECRSAMKIGRQIEDGWRNHGVLDTQLLLQYIDCAWNSVRKIETLASERRQ
ncbi:ATP-binding protein [Halomonas caseinilytica]|uniref:ATP-binding protein n=1 Tax=Halomonas caseinilytica TaxID=438744 RepID=UPI0009F49260|nr:ATP-binding protein [Halomonas caseinilytica]